MPEGYLLLPNFTTLGLSQFTLRSNPRCQQATEAAMTGIEDSGLFSRDDLKNLPRKQFGLLASLCYPTCDLPQLRNIIQFMILLHYQKQALSEEQQREDVLGEQEYGLLAAFSREASPNWSRRFSHSYQRFKDAQPGTLQSGRDALTSVDQYKTQRRNSSGIIPLLHLIEYASCLHVYDDTYAFGELEQLRGSSHDIIAWTQDIAAYNELQSLNDDRNLVAQLVARHGFVQSGIDEARELVMGSFKLFLATERLLFSKNPGEDVRRYVDGLRDCIIGHAHWLYYTDLFFEDGDAARQSGWVRLFPKARPV